MDTVPESSIHPCTPPPPLYVLGIRNIASTLAPPLPPPPTQYVLGKRNIKDYFILFYTKDRVSNRSVLFEG